MISRRDWQLQQIGITQWFVRRQTALQGCETIVSSPIYIRLVIVTDELLALNDTLISDVLHALKISVDHVLQIASDRLSMLPSNCSFNSWWLGTKKTLKLEGGCNLISPALKELQINPSAKRNLWQQICKYEMYFFS